MNCYCPRYRRRGERGVQPAPPGPDIERTRTASHSPTPSNEWPFIRTLIQRIASYSYAYLTNGLLFARFIWRIAACSIVVLSIAWVFGRLYSANREQQLVGLKSGASPSVSHYILPYHMSYRTIRVLLYYMYPNVLSTSSVSYYVIRVLPCYTCFTMSCDLDRTNTNEHEYGLI